MTKIRQLTTTDAEFDKQLASICEAQGALNQDVIEVTDAIIAKVRAEGDAALVELTRKFDVREIESVEALWVSADELKAAVARLPEGGYEQLALAAERIEWFHQNQKQDSWRVTDALGNTFGQRVLPLDSVGVYVPGGKASYPSSVLMNTIPAKVAGVDRIVMVSPFPRGEVNDWVLAAAHLAGVDEVITIGGAQAVAALAYGTDSIKAVDKIVGPGNAYVAAAKRAVYGQVGIDMIAGPSEVLIITDGSVDPDWIAMDMFAQCEHDEMAQALVLCPDVAFLGQLQESIARLLPTMERKAIIAAALEGRSALIATRDLADAASVSNRLAPEHLELAVSDPEALLEDIKHAGAVFLGAYATESLGDYCAGPNHVLPTSGTARFSSPLGVYDFEKRSSIIKVAALGGRRLADCTSVLARAEGLTAHAQSAEMRFKRDSDR
ncbi:MAG: histidinol dehydrogenase [Halieaceae bacterium]|nr:histidinol dehydrogenase [Halieaceae bacterium]